MIIFLINFYHFVLKKKDFMKNVLLYHEIFRTLQPINKPRVTSYKQ